MPSTQPLQGQRQRSASSPPVPPAAPLPPRLNNSRAPTRENSPPFSAPCARTPAPPPLPPSPLPCTLPASVAVSRARCSREPASACAVSAVPASRVAATPAFRASNSPTADCAQRAVRCHWRGGGLRHQNVVRRRRGSGRDGRAAGLGEKRVEQGGVRSIRKSVRATLLVPSAGRAGATRVRRKGRAAGGSRAGAGRSPLQVP